jgi:hypothetical protein
MNASILSGKKSAVKNLWKLSASRVFPPEQCWDVAMALKRTKVATDLTWKLARESLEESHDGDPSGRRDCPMNYWGLEPLDKIRRIWMVRYAAAFPIGETVTLSGVDSFV